MTSIDRPQPPHVAEVTPKLDSARMLNDHAASAARIGEHLDDVLATGRLEILGDPRAFVAPVPSARFTFALDSDLSGRFRLHMPLPGSVSPP